VLSSPPSQSRVVRKARGQFFTPVDTATALLRLARRDLEQLGLPDCCAGPMLDPACGDGSFLEAVLAAGWASTGEQLHGLDIDGAVASGPVGSCITVANGLLSQGEYDGSFAAAVGNPPYGGRGVRDLPAEGLELLATRFEAWRLDRAGCARAAARADRSRLSRFPISSLFVERFVRAVRPGGVVGILLPESFFCNRREAPLRAWVLRHAHLVSVTELPEDTFAGTGTRARTSFLVLSRRSQVLPDSEAVDATAPVLLHRLGEDSSSQTVTLGSLQQAGRWDPLFHEPRWTEHLDRCVLSLEPLGNFIETLCYGAIKVGERPVRVSSSGSLYVTQRAVADWGVDLAACPRIRSEAPFDTPRYRLTPGDLVVPRCGRGTLGRNRLTRFDGAPHPAVVDCFTDRLSLRGLSSAWVLGALRSPLGWDQIRRTFNGVGTPNLSFGEIRSLLVPMPTEALAQQAEAVWQDVAKGRRAFRELSDLVNSACGLH